jgi:hypothetical protein
MIAATFAPGGLGKTALARQYAHAYAEWFAAGGTWEIGCEGLTQIGQALLRLAEARELKSANLLRLDPQSRLPVTVVPPLDLTEEERSDPARAAPAVFAHLRALTEARVAVLREQLRLLPNRHCPAGLPPEIRQPRLLLILDNVDRPELLDARQIALLPAEEWLEVIVTTRLDPQRFGGGAKVFAPVEVGVLPDADAVRLLAEYQPEQRFAHAREEAAGLQIVQALGGYTLAVELVAAYLGDRAREGYRPSNYLPRLQQEGLVAPVDSLAQEPAVQARIRHSAEVAQNYIATLIRWSLDRLSPAARTALEFASLLQPDAIPRAWLETLTRAQHPEELAERPHQPKPWPGVWRELRGLRLLHPAQAVELDERRLERLPDLVRIHRLVAEHVARGAGELLPGRVSSPELSARMAQVDQFLDVVTTYFEQQVGQSAADGLRTQHPWLRDQLEFLIQNRKVTPTLLSSASVSATYEGEHGSLARAIAFTTSILAAKEGLLAAQPGSEELARDVSVSLERLAKLEGGREGRAEVALELQLRSLQIALDLRERNPGSWYYQRTAAVAFILTYGRARAAGQSELAQKCLAGCFAVLDPLVQAGVELDAPMRQLHDELRAAKDRG